MNISELNLTELRLVCCTLLNGNTCILHNYYFVEISAILLYLEKNSNGTTAVVEAARRPETQSRHSVGASGF